jgi:hypothetical protein
MRSSLFGIDRLTVSAKVATVLGSILASSDSGESDEAVLNICTVVHKKKKSKNPPFQNFSLDVFSQFFLSFYIPFLFRPALESLPGVWPQGSARWWPAIGLTSKSGDCLTRLIPFLQCCGSGMFIPDPGSKNRNKKER